MTSRRTRPPCANSSCVCLPRWRIRSWARAGVNVTATNREISSEETIVRARARKKTPGTPSRKARGMKTTTGVSVLPTRAGPTSRVTDRTACDGECPASSLAWIASTTTIASSITMPMAAAMPPKRHQVEAHVEDAHHHERHQHRDRDAHADDKRARQAPQEQVVDDDREDQPDHDALPDAPHAFAHEQRLIVEEGQLHVRRQFLADPLEFLLERAGDGHGVAVGLAVDVHQHGFGAFGGDDVELRGVAAPHRGDVAHVDRRLARPGHDHVFDLGRIAQAIVDHGQVELPVLLVHPGRRELVASPPAPC